MTQLHKLIVLPLSNLSPHTSLHASTHRHTHTPIPPLCLCLAPPPLLLLLLLSSPKTTFLFSILFFFLSRLFHYLSPPSSPTPQTDLNNNNSHTTHQALLHLFPPRILLFQLIIYPWVDHFAFSLVFQIHLHETTLLFPFLFSSLPPSPPFPTPILISAYIANAPVRLLCYGTSNYCYLSPPSSLLHVVISIPQSETTFARQSTT